MAWKNLIFILLFSIPCSGHTALTMPVSAYSSAPSAIPIVVKKGGFLKQMTEKIWRRHFIKSLVRSNKSDGKGFTILGLLICFLGVLSWFFSPLYGLLLSIPFGLAGLTLCIIGLIKASKWYNTRAIRYLAIAGIILNTVLITGTVIIFVLLAAP